MIQTYRLKALVSLFAVALASQACTITTGSDDDTEEDDGSGDDDQDAGGDDDGSDDAVEDDAAEDDATEDDAAEDDATEDDDDGTTDDSADDDGADDDSSADADAGADAGTDDDGSDDGDAGATTDDGTDDGTEADAGADDENPDDGSTGDKEWGREVAPDFECEREVPEGAMELSGGINDDMTLSGTVLVTGPVTFRDVDVTIEPGTHFVMEADTMIEFGWNGEATSVFADGTEDDPITFCGEDEESGSWQHVIFGTNVTSNSSFSNALIDGGGGVDYSLIFRSDMLIENVVVTRSAGTGVSASDFDEDSHGLFVTDSAEMAVTLTDQAAATNFPKGGNLTGNADDFAQITFTTINDDTTFHDLGIPYLLENTLTTRDGSTTTYEAGVRTHVASDSTVEFGWNSNDATVVIDGEADDPVVFRGEDSDSGYWQGMIVRGNVRSNSSIDNLIIRHTGADDRFALLVQAAIPISNLTLEDNEYGVQIAAQGLDEASENWTISGTADEPLRVAIDATTTLPPGSDFSDNENARVEIDGNTYRAVGTVPNVGIPYMVRDTITTRTDSEMTIAAGAEFIMAADTMLEVGWNSNVATINIEGTEDEPVRFTALDPLPGYWRGIVIRNDVTSSSAIDWLEVHHAGGGADAAILLQSPIPVTNTTIANSESGGIERDPESGVDYAESNTFVDNGGDDLVDL